MSILSGQALWQSNSRVQRCFRTDFPRCLGRYWPFADPSSLIKRWAYDDFFLVRGGNQFSSYRGRDSSNPARWSPVALRMCAGTCGAGYETATGCAGPRNT